MSGVVHGRAVWGRASCRHVARVLPALSAATLVLAGGAAGGGTAQGCSPPGCLCGGVCVRACTSAACSPSPLTARSPRPSSHLSFRPQPVLHLGDETVGSAFAPDKHVIKDSVHPNTDPLDSYFGF